MDEILQDFDKHGFTNDLVDWYEVNKRALPWRETRDPYKIWISEIMLQQTQVDTVIPYFQRFMAKYPTVQALAAADEHEVLKLWEGLGYYSRAQNLHTAAKMVVADFLGEIPDDKKAINQLKGVGPYTSGAILSIAFDQAQPAVDGNVFRVISRILNLHDNTSEGKTRKKFEAIVSELLKETKPSAFNQALMELGAMVCTPKTPQCLLCPVRDYCRGYEAGQVLNLPVKHKAKKQKRIDYMVLVLSNELGEFAIEKRPETGLLANMWQFPMLEGKDLSENKIRSVFQAQYGVDIALQQERYRLKHVFTHLIWQLNVVQAIVKDERDIQGLTFVSIKDLATYPISKSHQNIIERL